MVDGGAADEGAEDAAEVADADGHDASDAASKALAGGEGDVSQVGREAAGAEEAGGVEVVGHAAEELFFGAEGSIHERAVWAGAGHEKEVAADLAGGRLAGDVSEGNALWRA